MATMTRAGARAPERWQPYLVPLVALAVAAAIAASAGGTPRGGLALATVAVGSVLLVAAVYWDVRERRIPNAWTYPATATGLLLGALAGPEALAMALAGMAVAGGLLAACAVASRGGLGVGDIKLGAALGALVGPMGAVEVVLVSAIAGGVLGLAWVATGHGRRATLPYAPALAVGGWAALIMTGPVAG